MRPAIITLTTDFGLHGPYVAAVKGVLLERAPGVQIVDVCHTIAPQNVLEGAFVLANIVEIVSRLVAWRRRRPRNRPSPNQSRRRGDSQHTR